MIHIRLLGNPIITINDNSLINRISKKGLALLTYMLIEGKQEYTRENLANMFWTDYTHSSSLSNLRYTIWRIRDAFKTYGYCDVISNIGKTGITLNREFIESDILSFLEDHSDATDAKKIMEISKLYSGDFMEGFYLHDACYFNDWILNIRHDLQIRYFNIQYTLSDYYRDIGDIDGVRNELGKLIKIDPFNEDVYCRLIKAQLLAGNKSAAIASYKKIKRILRDELNISPNKELSDLYNDITYSDLINSSAPKYNTHSRVDKTTISIEKNNLSIDKLGNGISIEMGISPGFRVEYEGIFEMLESINNRLENVDLISFSQEGFSSDYMLFRSVCNALDNLGLSAIQINIKNMHFMDCKTIDFVSFLYRSNIRCNIVFNLSYDSSWENKRLDDFVSAHKSCEAVTSKI